MAKKHAILIANTEYRDGKLASLAHPGLAYAELADALRDPARGAFSQVETLVNANLSHVLNSLDRFFARKPADDVLLVYVGAHGFVDAQGELFLALKESDRFRLKSTALMAAVLGTNMDQCPSPHKLLILDCRYHSPFQDARGGQSPPRPDPAKVFAGRGLPKLILAAGEPAALPKPAAAPATPSTSATQKIQVMAPKDFTRALAETFRTPATANGGRNAFTVEDWWNEAIAELKSTKAEPPTRHSVGAPTLTVLRGASLPRPELALSSLGSESKVIMPALPMEHEADWSNLSGIFPLEMFAPEMADTAARAREADQEAAPEDPAEDEPTARTLQMEQAEGPLGDATHLADPGFIEGADLVLRARQRIESEHERPLDAEDGTLESPLSTSPTLEVPLMPGLETRHGLEAPTEEKPVTEERPALERRPDATLQFDLRLPPDLSGNSTLIWDRPKGEVAPPRTPTAAGPRDSFTDLRARLHAQEEEELRVKQDAEKEEAAQREKLEQWKARWDARAASREQGVEPSNPPAAAPAPEAPKPGKGSAYQRKIQALQKTLFVPGPDVDPGADTLIQPPPQETPVAPSVRDGLATVIVSKDQFLNTGVHKAPTQLTPGATILIDKDDLLSPQDPGTATREASAPTLEMEAAPPARPARPIRGDGRSRKAGKTPAGGEGPGNRRRLALWVLAGLAPLGLGLFLFFGYQAGLFEPLGLGPERAQAHAPAPAPARRISKVTPAPAVPEAAPDADSPAASILPEPPSQMTSPAAQTAPATPTAPAAQAAPAAPSAQATPAAPVAPAPRQTTPAPRQTAPATPAPAPAAPAPVPVPAPRVAAPKAPAPAPAAAAPSAERLARLQADSLRKAEWAARREAARAAKAAQDAEKLAKAKFRLDSLKAYRAFRDSMLTVRAQAKQDSIAQARLIRDLERAQQAEIDAIRLAAQRARQDSAKAAKDSVQSETLLRKSVNQSLRANAQEMRDLYNRFALGYPGLQGEVVVNLLVAPDGEIEKGTVYSSTTGIKMFDQLVLGNVMEWKIQPFKSREAKAILVPLRFPQP